MRREVFLVQDDGSTPETPLLRCFYCAALVGKEHGRGCVMRRRTVVLRATVEFVSEEAEDWTPETIGFYYNEGTWCADNLADLFERHAGPDGCVCSTTKVEFVREATQEDEARSAVRVGWIRD